MRMSQIGVAKTTQEGVSRQYYGLLDVPLEEI
jgi:hypothetical protein